MGQNLAQLITLLVCVIAFVLLTVACASDHWLVADANGVEVEQGLWKSCGMKGDEVI